MRILSRIRSFGFLPVAFVVLQLGDGILTTIGVYRYGLHLEANPIASALFTSIGVWQGALLAKFISFLVFFGFLWYCVAGRWSLLDVIGLLWRRKPKRDPVYAMFCFRIVGVVTLLASLYASGGWIYLLISLGIASK